MAGRRGRIRPTDVAVAAGFAAFGLLEEYLIRMPGGWWPWALAACTVLILVRRLLPVLVLVPNALMATELIYVDVTVNDEATVNFRLWQVFAMMIAAYTTGRHAPPLGPGRRLTRHGAQGLAAILLTVATYYRFNPDDPMADLFFPLAPYVLGVAVAAQHRRNAETAGALATLRERQTREAVTEERVRIARELHDMVAHSVTVMVVQAAVVRRRMAAGLEVDHDLLRSIESSGREAVGELRRTLGLLRGEESDAAQAPAGLDRLDELIAQVREAGLSVTLRREGEPGPLLPAVDMSAYRIVQEALTNVLKHAGPARATVQVAHRADGLHLSVVNDGRAVQPPAPGAGGQGLIGMRERVSLFGGELTAGPRQGGGFAVRARLPKITVAAR